MASKDYYKTLGVDKNATQDDIKKAYRDLAKKYHPDVSTEDNAEEKFKEVQEAYSVLSDNEKRQNYDRFGSEGPQFQGFGDAFSGFGDFGDIFSSFFGGGQTTRRSSSTGPQRGFDKEMNMTIDFMEAVLGTKKKININLDTNCSACNGTGAQSPGDVSTCGNCHGSGYVNVQQQTIFGSMVSERTCPTCGGTGKIIKNPCSSCNGKGRVEKNKVVEVNIPAGVDNGMALRVPGYGDEGFRGGANGDLFIKFKVKPHKVFKRKGNDIILDLDITFSQAALGTTVEIPTIYGEVDLKIPAGIQTGTSLRMRDKGIEQKLAKGNQYVNVNVVTPKNLTNEQKDLFNKLGNLETKERKSLFAKFKDIFK